MHCKVRSEQTDVIQMFELALFAWYITYLAG